jgi:hypothetical protein
VRISPGKTRGPLPAESTPQSAAHGLQVLRRALERHGGTLADSLLDEPRSGSDPARPGPPQLAAAGPRAAGHRTEYELLLEMILEGTLLHYGSSRLLCDDDRDLALLLGDQLYALGLARLAELGDLDAVAELADLISLLATARAAGDEPLGEALWRSGAMAIGWGTTAEHEIAKQLARRGEETAKTALDTAVTKRPRIR